MDRCGAATTFECVTGIKRCASSSGIALCVPNDESIRSSNLNNGVSLVGSNALAGQSGYDCSSVFASLQSAQQQEENNARHTRFVHMSGVAQAAVAAKLRAEAAAKQEAERIRREAEAHKREGSARWRNQKHYYKYNSDQSSSSSNASSSYWESKFFRYSAFNQNSTGSAATTPCQSERSRRLSRMDHAKQQLICDALKQFGFADIDDLDNTNLAKMFRKQALQYHPDRCLSQATVQATESFKLLSQYRDLLASFV